MDRKLQLAIGRVVNSDATDEEVVSFIREAMIAINADVDEARLLKVVQKVRKERRNTEE